MEDHAKDMLHVIAEHFEEEIEDACEYARLSEEYEHHDRKVAIALWQLGREEATHANYLHSVLEKHHHPISEQLNEHFHKMMRKFHFEK